jgi:ribosomal protein S18 acetylase RimI-like enzyme
VGFHQDDEQHWVADLECGHTQHVRHDPPWQQRPWVTTEAGRAQHMGMVLRCLHCGASDVAETSPEIAIELDVESAAAVRQEVLAGLRAHNRRYAAPPGFMSLTLSARDESGQLLGGLVAESGWEWLHIDLLWVEEAHRGRGIGRRLLQAAEDEARARGCRYVYLDTFDFQARSFYDRAGYTVFGIQKDYPPGHNRLYMLKALEQ